MGAVYLGEDISRVDEEDLVVLLGLVEKPEGGRKGDRVEHVGGQAEHAGDQVFLNEVLTDVGFAVARVRGRVGHHERGAALGLERGGEQADPEVVGIGHGDRALVLFLGVGLIAGNAVGVEALVAFHLGEVDFVYVEWRIGQDVIEPPKLP